MHVGRVEVDRTNSHMVLRKHGFYGSFQKLDYNFKNFIIQ